MRIDGLLGRQEIVIKSLGALKPYERSVFGVHGCLDPEGRIVLVLDVSRLTTREYHESVPTRLSRGCRLCHAR